MTALGNSNVNYLHGWPSKNTILSPNEESSGNDLKSIQIINLNRIGKPVFPIIIYNIKMIRIYIVFWNDIIKSEINVEPRSQ